MRWIWNFFAYSFLGFLLEVGYSRAIKAKKLDRKCRLFLPLCPVYGLGAVAITALPPVITSHPVLLFFVGGITATLVEYLAAAFYEKVWHVAFWDYHDLPGNLQGRVCVPFALIWGVLALGLVFWLHPRIDAVTALLPSQLLFPAVLIFAVDFVLTGHILRQTKNTQSLRWYRE